MKTSILGREFEVAEEPKDFWGWVAEGRYNSEWKMLNRYIRPEDIFIDLGAWVGSHSLFASTIARRVYAVEPDPVAFAILEQNVKGLPIHICRGAISDHVGTITLGSGLLGASTTRANRDAGNGIGPWVEGETFAVDCTTLRKFVDEMPSGVVEIADVKPSYFVKLDIEGGEEQVLKDFEWFEEHKPTVYIETHPWWWRNESDAWAALRRVANLYKYKVDDKMDQIDLNSVQPRHVMLTDRE